MTFVEFLDSRDLSARERMILVYYFALIRIEAELAALEGA